MTARTIIAGICMALAIWSATTHATGVSDSSTVAQGARLEVRADRDSATVYLDSVMIGRTPLVLDTVAPGSHIVRVVPPHPEEWNTGPVTDTVDLVAGQPNIFTFSLRSFISLTSIPPGASLYINDSLAGVTPLLLKPNDVHAGVDMTLKMPGFEPAGIGQEAMTGSALRIALKAGWKTPADETTPFLTGGEHWNPRRIGLYVSGGISILAGVAAAYFKIAADDKQSAYMETGDPSLLADRRRLDTWAGVSLAATQAALAILSYLLITE